jgi:hypothetical protein
MTENTFEQPNRDTIREQALSAAASMTHQFPPHSVTILELGRQ